jgi:hypothetical protein
MRHATNPLHGERRRRHPARTGHDASRRLSQVEKQMVPSELIASEAAGENRPQVNVE